MSEDTSNFFGFYVGRYEHQLDAQGRVALPSEWRNVSGETEMLMIPARGKALLLLPLGCFNDFISRAAKAAIADPKLQMALAYLGSESRRCRCDKQGRMALDREKLTSIGVKKELLLIGSVTHIRLCSPENWTLPENPDEYMNEIQKLTDKDSDLGMLGGLLKGVLK